MSFRNISTREVCLLLHEFGYTMMKWAPTYNVYFLFRSDLSFHDMNRHLDYATMSGVPHPWSKEEAVFVGYSDRRGNDA